MTDNLEPIFSNYEKSFRDFKALLTTNYEIEAYPPATADGQTFGVEFPGGLIRKPYYKDCRFNNSKFESSDGINSRFHNCSFYDCLFDNCDLRYCDINKSFFQNTVISDCGFNFGNFIDIHFLDIPFSGCSFRQMQIVNTLFEQCTMSGTSFEQSDFKNCTLKDLDLRFVGVRYCDFEGSTFENVVFHILDLPRNYGLIDQLRKSSKPVYVAYKKDKLMPLEEAVDYLKKLTLYYKETYQFYELINVHILHNEYNKIKEDFELALQSVVFSCDFASLQNLCSLLVKLNIFSNKQLIGFYNAIRQNIDATKLPHYLQKSYNTYIENIRCILADNPYNELEVNILLKTDIISLNDNSMTQLLSAVESSIKNLAPDVEMKIQLTHHSPYEVLLILIGALPEIQSVCQIFYYFIGGIKAISDLKNGHKKIINKNNTKQLPIENKEQEIVQRFKISIGTTMFFTYEKEFRQHVHSIEYITK